MRRNLSNRWVLTLILALSTIGAAQAEINIDEAQEGNRLVRIDGGERYVLLPIEDAAMESQVRIIVDTKLEQTINVRLAMDRVDYFVPLDLSAYRDKCIILDVRSDKRNERYVEDAVWISAISQSDTFDTANREPFRPTYHHTPLYGWMNDPNGLFYKDGVWHLFFQYGPYGSTWNNMTWGHSISSDLIHWTHLDNAVYPDGLGVIFSGSAVIDKDNSAGFGQDAVVAIYTQTEHSQVQSLSYSTDGGNTFNTYKANPVLVTPYEARDPKVFLYEETGQWIMILASVFARQIDIYSSSDLKEWTLESHFGAGYGSKDGVWECPDLVEVPIRATNEKRWVLISNVGRGQANGTQYFVGSFDGHSFVCDTPQETTKWVDYGMDHYAAVTWHNAPDDRTVLLAWMCGGQYSGDVPTQQYRSADTLPRDLELYYGADGDLYLSSLPSPEVEKARGAMVDIGSFNISDKVVSKNIPADFSEAYELDLELSGIDAETIVNIELSNSKGERVVMNYDSAAATFAMDRTQSGIVDFNPAFPCVTTAPCPTGAELHLRLFFDHSSMELFESEGRFTMTNILFPSEPYNTLRLSTAGGKAKVEKAVIYKMGE